MYIDVMNQIIEYQLHILLATYVMLQTQTHTVLLLVCDFSDSYINCILKGASVLKSH